MPETFLFWNPERCSKVGRSPVGAAPAQLFVLIDGVVIGSTRDFPPRVDVDQRCTPLRPRAGAFPLTRWAFHLGERVLQLAVNIEPGSDIRIVREQRVFVIAPEPFVDTATTSQKPASWPELDAMAARAASMLRERQTGDGFWLTSHTKRLRYEAPQAGNEHVPDFNAGGFALAGRTSAKSRRCSGAVDDDISRRRSKATD